MRDFVILETLVVCFQQEKNLRKCIHIVFPNLPARYGKGNDTAYDASQEVTLTQLAICQLASAFHFRASFCGAEIEDLNGKR